MRKRDELADPNSCMGKARDDEWTFVLLERDPAAAYTVRIWAAERIRMGLDTRDSPKIREALAWADTVDAIGRPSP